MQRSFDSMDTTTCSEFVPSYYSFVPLADYISNKDKCSKSPSKISKKMRLGLKISP